MQQEKSAGLHMRIVGNQIQRRMSLAVRQTGVDDITGSNGWILEFLQRNPNREVFQKDVEAEFLLARSTVTAVIKLMERKGFIKRESVPYDARLKRLLLTDKGRQIQEQLGDVIETVEQSLVAGIAEEDIRTFHRVLDQISKNAEI